MEYKVVPFVASINTAFASMISGASVFAGRKQALKT